MEQYLLLAKGARGRALVDLIQKVTADPVVFAFGELLDVPSIKEVGDRLPNLCFSITFQSADAYVALENSVIGRSGCWTDSMNRTACASLIAVLLKKCAHYICSLSSPSSSHHISCCNYLHIAHGLTTKVGLFLQLGHSCIL
jgi:hypothetical protein